MTASIGIASLQDGESLQAVMRRADRALYAAKGSGRNRVSRDPGAITEISSQPPEPGMEDYLVAATASDAAGLRRIAERTAQAHGPVGLYARLIEPVFDEVGARWERGAMRVADEHLVSASSALLLEEIHGRGRGDRGVVVLAPAPGNAHRLGLMAAADLFTRAGWRSVTLGSSLEVGGLVDVASRLRADALGVSVATDSDLELVQELVPALAGALPSCAVLVGGSALRRVPDWRPPPGAHLARDASDTAELARRLRAPFAPRRGRGRDGDPSDRGERLPEFGA